MAELFWFSDEQWSRIEPLLPTNTRGMPRVDDRRVLSGIVHVLKSGCRWSDCPGAYGPCKTIYNRFVRWAKRGIWEDILPVFRRRKRGAFIHAIGRSKGGRTTKIHTVTDAQGRPVVMVLTPGNTSDHKAARLCLEAMPPSKYMIADKGYDSAALREWLEERGTEPVIPPRVNRKVQYAYDKALYRTRNIIERSFGRLKDYRRIATRFDKDVRNFLAALCIAVTVIWWI